MAMYNNGFPVSYQQLYPQQQPQFGFQPSQVPQQIQPQQQQQQMLTPPTIHAEIVQVSDKQEALNFPVGAGQAQMMIARDDSAIYVKTAYANGQSNLVEYVRKEAEPEAPTPDYVTREEFEQRLAEISKSKAITKPERKVKEDEHV